MTIKPFQEKDGSTTYRVTVMTRSPDNRAVRVQKKKFGIETIAEAKRIETQLKKEAERDLVAREQQGSSWEKLVNEWKIALSEGTGGSRISATTSEDYLTALRKYTTKWNNKSAASIRRPDVVQVIREMEEIGRSKGRIQCVLIAINAVFRWAIDLRLVKGVEQSPATGLMLKRDEEKKPEILTLAQIQKLLDYAQAIDHPWYPVWATALFTGMRSGELHELKWDDVDMENGIITVSRSWNSRMKIVKCTKAGYWREVPINDPLLLLFKQLKLKRGTNPYVLPRFHNWTRGTTSGILRKFCLGTGIPSIKFHTLRACFATMLLRDAVAPAVVMKICGWKDLKTMQHYIRLAGIEIQGATNTKSMKFLSPRETVGRVVQLFGSEANA